MSLLFNRNTYETKFHSHYLLSVKIEGSAPFPAPGPGLGGRLRTAWEVLTPGVGRVQGASAPLKFHTSPACASLAFPERPGPSQPIAAGLHTGGTV